MGAVLIPPLPPPKPSRYAASGFSLCPMTPTLPPTCELLQRAGHVINTTKALWRIAS